MSFKIKEFLKKVPKLEFKTDTGRYNFCASLILGALFAGLEIRTFVKEIIWQAVFHRKFESNMDRYIIYMICFFALSTFIAFLADKK